MSHSLSERKHSTSPLCFPSDSDRGALLSGVSLLCRSAVEKREDHYGISLPFCCYTWTRRLPVASVVFSEPKHIAMLGDMDASSARHLLQSYHQLGGYGRVGGRKLVPS